MDLVVHCAMTVGWYDLYGLRIGSDLPLAAAPSSRDDGPCDVRVILGPATPAVEGTPEGRPVAELVDRGERMYTATQHDAGYTFRVHGLGDFELASGLDLIECRPGADLSPELAGILLTGTIVSFILGLRGTHVLHGSAVRTPLGAVAFVAGSGMGKSTLAAQFCARKAELITDDVLALHLGDPIEVLGGSTELRLREKAASVVDDFGVLPLTRVTADERLAVRPSVIAVERSPLAAILCPRPSTGTDALRLEAMSAADALWELSAWPRIAACDPQHIARQFEGNAALVQRVPVYRAQVPWGPPFIATMPDEVLEGLLLGG